MDTKKVGQIKTGEFIKLLKDQITDEEFNEFFVISSEELVSKSENLLRKLREIEEDPEVKGSSRGIFNEFSEWTAS